MEKKLKHLEMLQAVISRMAKNSFLLKGWNVVLVSAIFVLASSESRSHLVFLAYLPTAAFWLLDGYFLRQERLFRKLYDEVRVKSENDIDFCMNTTPIDAQVASWLTVAVSRTLLLFHGAVVLTITAAWLVLMVLHSIQGAGES